MNTTTIEKRLNVKISEGKELFVRKFKDFVDKINKKKVLFLQKMKEQDHFVEHCPKRGYIYYVVQFIDGYITRVTISFKNGYLTVMDMEPAEEMAA